LGKENTIVDLIEILESMLTARPWIHTLLMLALLLFVSWGVNWITRHLVLRLVRHAVEKLRHVDGEDSIELSIASRLANVAPLLVISLGIGMVPALPELLVIVVLNVCNAIIIFTLMFVIAHVLEYANVLYMRRPDSAGRPIKGYLQVAKLVAYIIGTLLVISVLIDRNPLILLSGIGAMAAVLMLIFQDTLLSLVASIQISSSGIVRVGDWIEMPQVGADGEVVDIALHTVTVCNWDNTYSVFPARKLVGESFKNWRGMSESGGRRIKRALYLDQTSVRFLNDTEISRLHRFAVLDEYLDDKANELGEWNRKLQEQGKDPINARRITNLGTFRAYINHYLEQHPKIHKRMTLLVRQLQPGATGIPLEIYCFTSTTAWGNYENIQSDIFDHLLATLPEFDLRVFQQPGGADIRNLFPAITT